METVKKERLNHALVESVAEVAITDGPPVSREDRMQWARKILAHLKDQKKKKASRSFSSQRRHRAAAKSSDGACEKASCFSRAELEKLPCYSHGLEQARDDNRSQ